MVKITGEKSSYKRGHINTFAGVPPLIVRQSCFPVICVFACFFVIHYCLTYLGVFSIIIIIIMVYLI